MLCHKESQMNEKYGEEEKLCVLNGNICYKVNYKKKKCRIRAQILFSAFQCLTLECYGF